jgi:hypothetical protein
MLGLLGIQATDPQVVSVSVGVMATAVPPHWDCRAACDFRGPFAQLEPGLGGGKAGVGWGRVIGATGPCGAAVSRVHLALAGKLTVLHSRGTLGLEAPGRTWVGPELDASIARLNLGLGVLCRVDSDPHGRWLVSAGFGWGF